MVGWAGGRGGGGEGELLRGGVGVEKVRRVMW